MCPEGAQVELERERCVPKVLMLSCEVSQCKPLLPGTVAAGWGALRRKLERGEPVRVAAVGSSVLGRGFHSFLLQLNLSSSLHRVTQLYS